MNVTDNIEKTLLLWKANWPKALKIWSNYVKLREPIWCKNTKECMEAGIADSFAMIRLIDHRIVIDLRQVIDLKLENRSLEILAHEVGHHIYTPANLNDNAIVLSKLRWSLIGLEDYVPMAANLYEDLLINDRLQRSKGLNMADVYKKVNTDSNTTELWTLYMRTYEYLWKLKRGELALDLSLHSESIDADASLIASMIRSYSKNWLAGTSRFGAMLYPYLLKEKDTNKGLLISFMDTKEAGNNGGIASGMVQIDTEVKEGLIDPRQEAGGYSAEQQNIVSAEELLNKKGGVGPEQRYLGPGVYVDLLQQIDPNLDEQELINNYYKEIALPYLIDFPVDRNDNKSLDLPEGMDIWNVGEDLDELDWIQTSINNPQILPGINTLKRVYGSSEESNDIRSALNVYIGIDCSGSMVDPRNLFSWPVLAAVIIALSAFRAGAAVMGCLSGEPGTFLQNEGYESDERIVLTVLTSYLGTGYAFGIGRFKEPFNKPLQKRSHVLMVTDDDLFAMLDAKNDTNDDHWEVIEQTIINAGGTGTIVLHSKPDWHRSEVKRLKTMGWNIYYVTDQEELLKFASEFAKNNYQFT